MSLDANHKAPVITRDNYEEYLLMYVDGELNPQEMGLVEAFLQFHPDLQAELDALMSTKLEPEALTFEGKDSLLSPAMGQNIIDEALLLHLDGELPAGESEKVKGRLQHDKTYQEQYQWLLRTKVDAAEVVPCPRKEDLYRHTIHRIGLRPALRVAAAVLLLLAVGGAWWMQSGPENSAPAVASLPVKKAASPAATGQPEVKPVDGQLEKNGVTEMAAAPQLAQAAPKAKKEANNPRSNEAPREEIATTQKAPDPRDLIAYEPRPVPQRSMEGQEAQPALEGKKNAAPPVTFPAAQAYNNQTAAPEPSFASANDDEGRGNKTNLKALLRKATRLVERRAGIDATNDDDELIIGAVAIKLK